MRILVTGAGAFVGAHLERELRAHGHHTVSEGGDIDGAIHLSPEGVRAALDEAWARKAGVFVLMTTIGAKVEGARGARAAAGMAEEVVRAAGLPWAALRPDVIWGPGDVFTNEIATLMRHLPFVPTPRGGVRLAPVHVADVAEALVTLVTDRDLLGQVFSLRGPEELSYAEIVDRVARATLGSERRRPVKVPAWSVRLGTALGERMRRRPRLSRELIDWRVAVEVVPRAPPLPAHHPARAMTVEWLREYLGDEHGEDAGNLPAGPLS